MTDLVTLDGSIPINETTEDDSLKTKKVSLFDFVGDISYNKAYLLNEETESEFVPFMVNKALSQNVDTIMFANEMNKNRYGSKEMTHDFLFHSVSKKKRYGKWAKADNSKEADIKLLMAHYKANRRHAMYYLSILTDEQLNSVRQLNYTGGKSK